MLFNVYIERILNNKHNVNGNRIGIEQEHREQLNISPNTLLFVDHLSLIYDDGKQVQHYFKSMTKTCRKYNLNDNKTGAMNISNTLIPLNIQKENTNIS